MRVYVSITMTASSFRIVQLARLETKGRSFKRGSFSTQFIFFLRLRRLFFLFPFPIVFGSRNFFLFFSFSSRERFPWFKHAGDMPESLLSHDANFKVEGGLTVDRHCLLFWLFFFFPISFSFFFFVSVLFFFLFSFWWWWSRFWSGCISSLLFSSLFSLSYLETCSMVPPPPQFPPPPLLVEICSLVSGWTMWIVGEEEEVFNP